MREDTLKTEDTQERVVIDDHHASINANVNPVGLSNSTEKIFTPQVFNRSNFPREFRSQPWVDITRKGEWGNPFVIGVHGDREDVMRKYEAMMTNDLYRSEVIRRHFVKELSGRNLVCCCKPLACHGDIILKLLSAINCNPELRNGFPQIGKLISHPHVTNYAQRDTMRNSLAQTYVVGWSTRAAKP